MYRVFALKHNSVAKVEKYIFVNIRTFSFCRAALSEYLFMVIIVDFCEDKYLFIGIVLAL